MTAKSGVAAKIDSLPGTLPGGALFGDSGFLAVPRSLFTDEFLFDFDLYVRGASGYVLYWARAASSSSELCTRLMETNAETVFVRNSDEDSYNKYLEKCLPTILCDSTRSLEEKARILRHCSVSLMSRIFERLCDEESSNESVEKYLPTVLCDSTRSTEDKAGILHSCSSHVVKRAMEEPTNGKRLHMAGVLARHLVDQIVGNKDMFSKLVTLTSHHYYTYTHCVDVCIYSVALAQRLGSFDKAQLSALGLGAMLHDLGKIKISNETLDRNGPLSQDEWVIMKQHPTWSCDMVQACYALPEMSRAAILQHHERCDGTGYPAGLDRDSIDAMAKVVMIADVYSALTTKRAYKDAATPLAAVTTMVVEMTGFFESAMLKEFIHLLGDMGMSHDSGHRSLANVG